MKRAVFYILVLEVLLSAALEAFAQTGLTTLMASDTAAEQLNQQQQQQIQNYTFKTGDFRMLAQTSVEMDWNDNINLVKTGAEQDYILRPLLRLSASYPLTENNVLAVTLGAGYDKYFEHNNLSTWDLQSGSQLAFHATIKDFRIELHDRFSYVQDSAQEAAIANTGSYGSFRNTAGVAVVTDLNAVTLTLGYDHQIVEATSSQFELDDMNSDILTSRAGLHLIQNLIVGVEATGAFTSYDQQELNNNDSYSFGVYGDWKAGPLRVQPRAGYSVYLFQQTSSLVPANNNASYYFNLAVVQELTKTLSYSLSAGRDSSFGIDTDLVQKWFARPSVSWKGIKNLNVVFNLSYEHGSQSLGSVPGTAFGGEVYDYLLVGLSLDYQINERITASGLGRFIMRSSTVSTQEYSQNMLGLRFSYIL
jgi:hypothetical protein